MADAYRPTALVVEDDGLQRLAAATLLQETDMDVIQCESGEAAELVLNRQGGCLCLMFTDVNLSGRMTGAELAALAAERFPHMRVIVTSGRGPPALPPGALFMAKPWRPAELVEEARASRH
jgi:two-component system, cell cycle response regulator CpdR